MVPRIQLQNLLEDILGSRNVYFQPPENLAMKYPAIVYNVDDGDTIFADNAPYRYSKRYMVTYIDADPDSDVPDKIAMLPMCRFSRAYAVDNLNHTVFNIFF